MILPSRILGVLAAAALACGAWYAWQNYGAFANVARWTGDSDLGWLRPWLMEFCTPILCVMAFLTLSALSWIWQKLKLGH